MYYIGIDSGTSACKLLLVDEKGNGINSVSEEYPIYYPQNGRSEQNPTDWWNACLSGIGKLTADIDKKLIKGIGIAGQMHGLVVFLGNFGPETPETLISEWFDGPIMYVAAAEGDGDLIAAEVTPTAECSTAHTISGCATKLPTFPNIPSAQRKKSLRKSRNSYRLHGQSSVLMG